MVLLDSEHWEFTSANFDGTEFDYSSKKPDGQYTHRYSLEIEKVKQDSSQSDKILVSFMMNPSDAGLVDNSEQQISDKTVNSLIDIFGDDYNKIIVVNMFSFYGPNSNELYFSDINYNGCNHEKNLCEIKRILNDESFDMFIGTGKKITTNMQEKYYKKIMDILVDAKQKIYVREISDGFAEHLHRRCVKWPRKIDDLKKADYKDGTLNYK